MHVIYILLTLLLLVVVNADKEYGYFNYKMNHIENCQGPKRKNCCRDTMQLNGRFMVAKVNCTENVSLTKGKVVTLKGRQKLRLQMDKPCKHLFIKPLLVSVFNVTESCVIAKNIYYANMDLEEVAHKYYGGMFLYGNWTFQSMFYSDDCNILCLIIKVSIEPKKEQ